MEIPKSLLNVNSVSTKGIEKQLTRIADCLETIIRIEYNWNMTAPKPLPNSSSTEDEVSYSSDQETFKQELEASLRGGPPDESKEELIP